MPSSATERRAPIAPRVAALLMIALTLACAAAPRAPRYAALVVNETGGALCALQIRDAQGAEFRENRLRRDEQLPWGGVVLLGALPAGNYLVRATPCDGTPIDLPLAIGADAARPALRFGDRPRDDFALDLVNPASNDVTLCAAEIEPLYGGGGAARVTLDPPLSPGATHRLGPLAAGHYEIRLVGCEGGGYGLALTIGEGQTSEWRLGSEPGHTLQTR